MCEKFESIFKTYCESVIDNHPKYSSVKNNSRAKEIFNDIIDDVMPLFFKANPFFGTAIDTIVLSPINDELIESYTKSKSKSKKRVNKPIRTINAYTALFIPIVRKIAEPILMKYDEKEEGINYNRITNINSIAAKIFKNISDPDKYSDTYVYENSAIQARASNPENSSKIIEKYSAVIQQLKEDKQWIESQIVETPDDELKETKNELAKQCIEDHNSVYSTINSYIIDFMECYKDALRDLCIDKPNKKVKKNSDEENEENEETEEENDVKKEEEFNPLNVPALNFSIPPPENFSAIVPPLPNEAPSFDTTTKPKKSKKTSKKSVKN